MEYKNIKPKRVWTVLLIILLAVLAALTCFVSVKPAGVYVEWARYGVYATGVGLEGIVPAGSIIITDRTVAVSDYSVAAAFVKNGDINYPADTESALFGILRIEDGKYSISNGDNTVEINKQQAEQVVFYIDGLGIVTHILYSHRYFVWGAWAAIFTLIIVLICTSGNRIAKKKKKQLTKIFEFYGEKYDTEEKNKDY